MQMPTSPPAWHGEVLREREGVAESKKTYLDWDAAKKELRDRFASSPKPL